LLAVVLIGVEPLPKRQKLEPSVLEQESSGSSTRNAEGKEASKMVIALPAHHPEPKRRRPVAKVIEITSSPSSSDDDGSDFDDELNRMRGARNTSRRTMLLEDDEFEWPEEEEESKSRVKKKQLSAPSTKRRSTPTARTTRTTTTTTTTTTPTPTTTTSTRSRNSLPASSLRTLKEPQDLGENRRAAKWGTAILDDDGEVSLGSEFDPDLDFDISPLAIGPTNGHRKQSVVTGKRVMDKGEESIVAPRRGRKSRGSEIVVDEIDEEGEDYDDDEYDDPLLQPAKPTDIFQWHSQSQGLSQGGAQLPDVEG
jgi:hypothetical protein